ncbi:Sensory neuron membrane protein 2, partial [Operophtera brumata]
MGLLNLMACQGAPAIASLPHFYLASEELLEYFADGISPDKEKHNTYVYIDPVTGVVLKGVRRLQFNIELRQVPDVPQLRSVPTGLFPMLWLEEVCFIIIKQVTGVVLKGVRRLQLNIELRQVPDVPQLRSVPTGLFLMLWLEEVCFIIIEVLKGVRRLQVNIELRQVPDVPQLRSVPTGLFPMLWLEE